MQDLFAALWWMPYLLLVIAAFFAFAVCKRIYRMMLFRRDRKVAMRMAKDDPAFEKLLGLFNPVSLVPETLACLVCTGLLLALSIFWARQVA